MFSGVGGNVVGVTIAGWQIEWSHASGSPAVHRSQTKPGSGHCRSSAQTAPPHTGPFDASTHEQPVSLEAPFANTSNGRHANPRGQAPSQVGWPESAQAVGGPNVATHWSINGASSSAVPVHVPFRSAFAIDARRAFSAFARQAGPLVGALRAQTISLRVRVPAAFSFFAAQRASPEIALLNAVAHSTTPASTASAVPKHSPFPSAFSKLARSFDATLFRQSVSTEAPRDTAFAWHPTHADAARPDAFAFTAAHFSGGSTRANVRIPPPARKPAAIQRMRVLSRRLMRVVLPMYPRLVQLASITAPPAAWPKPREAPFACFSGPAPT